MKGKLTEVGSDPESHRPIVKVEMGEADAQALAAHLYRPVEVVPAAAAKVLQYKGRVEAARLGLAALRGEMRIVLLRITRLPDSEVVAHELPANQAVQRPLVDAEAVEVVRG